MAPVNRRSFIAGLIAAPILAALVPATVKARPYHIGDHTLMIEAEKWDTPDAYRVALWDGTHFIRVVQPRYLGRELVIPIEGRDGRWLETRFRYDFDRVGMLDAYNAEYVSGTKWWTR